MSNVWIKKPHLSFVSLEQFVLQFESHCCSVIAASFHLQEFNTAPQESCGLTSVSNSHYELSMCTNSRRGLTHLNALQSSLWTEISSGESRLALSLLPTAAFQFTGGERLHGDSSTATAVAQGEGPGWIKDSPDDSRVLRIEMRQEDKIGSVPLMCYLAIWKL